MIVAAAVSADQEVLDPVRAMLRAQATPECTSPELFASEECAIGWIGTSDRHAPFPLVRRGGEGNLMRRSTRPVSSPTARRNSRRSRRPRR